jgi:hypothetical protein
VIANTFRNLSFWKLVGLSGFELAARYSLFANPVYYWIERSVLAYIGSDKNIRKLAMERDSTAWEILNFPTKGLRSKRRRFIWRIFQGLVVQRWVSANHIGYNLTCCSGTPERCEGKGGRFSWKGTFELIYTKRCLENIGSWTSPNHVFYLLDDRGVRGFSDRQSCYSWSSMTAFLAFSEANSYKNCTNILDNSLFPLNWKGTFAPLAPPGKGQRGRLPLLPPSSGVPAAVLVCLFQNFREENSYRSRRDLWRNIQSKFMTSCEEVCFEL